MNNERRKKLAIIAAQLEEITQDEQDAYDNMPENLQQSDKGEEIEEGLTLLQEMTEALEEMLS